MLRLLMGACKAHLAKENRLDDCRPSIPERLHSGYDVVSEYIVLHFLQLHKFFIISANCSE